MECKNCSQALNSKDKFCSNCGQKNIFKLNMKFIFGEFFQTIFNLDSKALRSLKYLVFKPGFLTKAYIEGKRVTYLAPIRIYLVLSFLFFFLIAAFDFDNGSTDSNRDFSFSINNEGAELNNDNIPVNKIDGTTFSIAGENVIIPTNQLKQMQYDGTLEKGLDSLTADMPKVAGYVSRKLAIASVDDKGFMDVVRDQFSLFLILFLPFFALLYATVFSGNKRGFVGHLIFNLHLNSFIIFALLMDLFVGSIFRNFESTSFIWGVIMILYGQYYIIKAVMVFYQRKWHVAIYKYVLLLFGYGILALVFIIAVFFSSIIML